MKRRQFFGWMGKISAAIGMGYILSGSLNDSMAAIEGPIPDTPQGESKMRMNGRACHDYRMISNDRSIILDKEIFLS
jgi:hypothetical protein